MSKPTREHIHDIVTANRAIRAPYYDSDQGLAWGDDIMPALMGLFHIQKDPRWIDFNKEEELDEGQVTEWVRQAAVIPGWFPGWEPTQRTGGGYRIRVSS